MKKVDILKRYRIQKAGSNISPSTKRIIKQAVKKAVNEYREVYKRLATE